VEDQVTPGSLKLGIIGAGRIARIHARSVQAVAGASVAGVTDIEGERAQQLAATYHTRSYASVEALLADKTIDAAIICTPTALHVEQAVMAAQAGKHILCEKPLAMTLAEADRIIAAAEQAGVVLMVGHVLRLMPEYMRARELLSSGQLGGVHCLLAARMSGMTAGAWQGWILDDRYSLGVFDAQIHDLDFFTWLLGPGRNITSHGWRAPGGAWLHVDSCLVYDETCWAIAESSFAVPPTFPFTMHLRAICEKGVLEFHFQGESYAQSTTRRLSLYPEQGSVQDVTPPAGDPYADQMGRFVTSIRSGEISLHGRPEDARAVLGLALAARRSLERGGKPIDLQADTS
jgi:predicted dehydrogenase